MGNYISSYFSNLGLRMAQSVYEKYVTRENIQRALFLTGLSFASYNLLAVTGKVTSYLLTTETNLISRYGIDSWALVTGGSDGIGKEFAVQLARRGFNIILVARNEEKMNAVRTEITTKFPNISVRIVVADFSKCAEPGFFERIESEVAGLDISILLNNVGDACIDEYHLIPYEKIRNLVLLNCLAQALMTRVFLPRLLNRPQKKNRSAILDVSSLASEYPRPYLQLYAATKTFAQFLSEGLAVEHPNLDIISLKPGLVATKMIGDKQLDMKVCTAEQFVSSSLRYLGKTNSTAGHWKHQYLSTFLNALPESMLQKRLKTNLWVLLQENKAGQSVATAAAAAKSTN
jgi:17beta-estradiol 17-dehydrogenase / very-long-chain 3-oxoacyl-CoA reductase